MSSTTQHEVKAASAVLSDDIICQSFIQSSSTLAYACLLIRRKKYELATHVLHSLEAKQASRFKDMVFYLQAQIGIETGEYAVVKKRLVPRVNQHPNDMVALSLLEADIYLEWVAWQSRQPEAAAKIASDAARESSSEAAPALRFSGTMPAQSAGVSAFIAPAAPAPVVTVAASDALDSDFGIYQGLAADENTQALALGNRESGRFKSICRNGSVESLIGLLPQMLPSGVAGACADLESGEIHKICFSFQYMTVTSLHKGAEQLALVTGNINQSLLTMVRAENIFQKQTRSALAASAPARARPASQSMEAPSHE